MPFRPALVYRIPWLLGLLLYTTAAAGQSRLTVSRPAMGTPWSVTVAAADTTGAGAAIARAYARVEAVERVASDYRTDSEINTLRPGWQRVSPDLHRLVRASRRLYRRSGGAFDVTVGHLTRLWRRAFRQQQFPDPQDVHRARTQVQGQALRAGPFRRVYLPPGSRLDFGGIAKGYGIDAAAEVLRAAGFDRYLIDGGGDLLLGEPPPGATGWRVQVPGGTLDTARVAVATSGSAFRYLEHDGKRYSHIIDPRTGYGITDPRSVTVLAPTATHADGLASALSVLGEGKRKALLLRYRGTARWGEVNR